MGIESLLQQNLQSSGLAGVDRLARNAMFPQSQMDKTQYATPSQMPTSAETIRSDYDTPTNAYTGLPTQQFNKGGIARFVSGGIGSTGTDNTDAKKATVADLYKKILGREASAEETGQWTDYLDVENPNQGILALADRLAQTEEGTAYGKKNPKDVYKAVAALSQADSPFAGMDTPYSNMRYVGTSNQTMYGGETTPDSVTSKHMFQDENGGIITVDQYGQPIEYSPGKGWYQEQYQKHPDALRQYGYRNQTYLAAGPLDQTYKFNGYDVPVKAGEYQVDSKTGQLITGKTGDYKPLELKPQDYNMWDDWAAPVAVVAIPALAAGAVYAAPYLAGEAAAGTVAAGATEGAAAGTAVAGAAEGAAAAESAAAAAEGVSQALPYTEAFDAANMAKNGYDAATIAQNLAGSGVDSFMAQDLATMAANGYAPEAMQQALQYGYSAKELAPVGLQSLQVAPAAASAGLTAKQAYAAKMGLDMLSSGMGGNQTQGGGGVSSTVAAAPTIPQINRFGITGYEGIEGKPADYKSVMELTPKTYLSKLRGVPGEQTFNQGGIADLGGYSDGGRLLRGPGDGMSDNIPASIGGKQPARLADGEFVIPADVVSHLGNGSTDAGAKQLYKMMDRIRKARTGNKKQGKQINPNKFLP